MSTLAEIDLDGLIQALDAIHGLVKSDPDGAQAWLGDLMLSLRTPPEQASLPGLEFGPEGPPSSGNPPFEPTGRRRPAEEPEQYSKPSRIYRLMFGKHAGKTLLQIVEEGEEDYLEWLVRAERIGDSTKKEVQRFLKSLRRGPIRV